MLAAHYARRPQPLPSDHRRYPVFRITATWEAHLSVWLARPVGEGLGFSEKVRAILLHHDKMCSLTDFDEPLVRSAREFVEEGLRALAGSHPIPLGHEHQGSNLDALRIVVWLSLAPIISEGPKQGRRD